MPSLSRTSDLLYRLPLTPFTLIRNLVFESPRQSRFASTQIQDPKKQYSHTLLLPKTDFPLRNRNPAEVEARYRERTTQELYRKQRESKTGAEFILHDGPPYANGNLHMGHALNRALKDIINRYKLLRGHRIKYIPGWDCHGLPIEQKALQEAESSHMDLSPARIRGLARKTAQEAISTQKKAMQMLGTLADWENETYQTMSHDYEVRQLKLFVKLVEAGYITYRRRPVYYSPSSRTALAESELKYEDNHQSRSVYVGFSVAKMSAGLRQILAGQRGDVVRILAWTTTPWTLPANMGIAVSKDISYAAVRHDNELWIIAKNRIEALIPILGKMDMVAEISGELLLGTIYVHRFAPKGGFQVFSSNHVTSDTGTGLVHSAPGHGHEDYEAFMGAGISVNDLRCPVDDDGKFTIELDHWSESSSSSLVGKSVLGDGVGAVISLLQKDGIILGEETVKHRYPYDWKTKQPVIIRSTPQWFADLTSITPLALKALEEVDFVPPQSRNRLKAFVESRSEWCISRQRSWGVPIPAIFRNGEPVLEPSVIRHVVSVLEQKGCDAWWNEPAESFVPVSMDGNLVKCQDTLDVWFDSGTSWTMLDHETRRPADVYLEGSDQHRGWFQSSLLTHVGYTGSPAAPYNTLITHGFVMDENGQKMSKSAGNGIAPTDIVDEHGADTLRLWAASVDYTKDVSIGESSIKQAAEILRKARSVLRFAMSAGEQSEPSTEVDLTLIDRFALNQSHQFELDVIKHYDDFAFNRVIVALQEWLAMVSNVYFESVKDTLYCDGLGSRRRLAVTLVLRKIFEIGLKAIAPFAPHLAEELWEHNGNLRSFFLEDWESSQAPFESPDISSILTVRSIIQSVVESRRNKDIRNVTAVDVAIRGLPGYDDREVAQILGVSKIKSVETLSHDWRESRSINGHSGKIEVTIAPSEDHQCPRCWRYQSQAPSRLCSRCESVLGG